MSARTDTFDLGPLHLRAGEARHLELEVPLDHFELSNERYDVRPTPIPIHLDASKMTDGGWSLRLRSARRAPRAVHALPGARLARLRRRRLRGRPARRRRGAGFALRRRRGLDVAAWTRDALALSSRPTSSAGSHCLGLCPECGIDLNNAGPEHHHEKAPDPRWAALSELKLDS